MKIKTLLNLNNSKLIKIRKIFDHACALNSPQRVIVIFFGNRLPLKFLIVFSN